MADNPMLSLLYLSYSLLSDETADRAVQNIVDTAVVSNKSNGLTGALIFTGVNFCQFLEGPEDALRALMESIRLDTRHKDIWVVHEEAVSNRRFGSWSMAYQGRSTFVSGHLMDLISASVEAERAKSVKLIISMMEEFAK